MHTDIKISVIVPVYNVEQYLSLLLDSISNQSEKSIEIIAINDGSTDCSDQILQDFVKIEPRLLVLTKPNGGLSSARNLGLKHAKGKWIAFVDSDDWLAPSALKTWLNQAEKQNLDFLLGNGYRFTEDPIKELNLGNTLISQKPWDEVISGEEWLMRSVTTNNHPNAAVLKFVHNELIKNNNLQFIEGIVNEDILWTLHLAHYAQRVGYCPTPFYGYRINPDSIINSQIQKSIISRVESYIEVFQRIVTDTSRSPKRLRKASMMLINTEALKCLGLIRKKIESPEVKYKLAKKMLTPTLALSMLQGATTLRELWHTIRCWVFLYQIIFMNNTKYLQKKSSKG